MALTVQEIRQKAAENNEKATVSNAQKRRTGAPFRTRGLEMGSFDQCLGWDAMEPTTNASLAHTIGKVRNRCRDLARQNDYVKQFIRSAQDNVIGDRPLKLQGKIKWSSGKKAGTLDKPFNQNLEKLYCSAGKKKHKPTRSGRNSLWQAQRLWLRTLIVDGEVLVLWHPGANKNKSRFQFEFIDSARLDHTLNHDPTQPGGGYIKMGVEFNADDEPVAYWILENIPSEHVLTGVAGHNHQRVPAEQITHSFIQEEPNQVRGLSFLVSSGMRAHLMERFEKANVVGATVAASKVGFYKVDQQAAEEYGVLGNEVSAEDGEYCEDVNDDARLVQDMVPGSMEQLPSYIDDIKTFDPQYPGIGFDEFEKRMLRGMGAGFGAQYHSLANDLQGVNYTSSRTGELSQRDVWRSIQRFIIEEFAEQHFERWADILPLTEASIDRGKLSKLLDEELYSIVARGWSWVDPEKEFKAYERALENGLITRSRIMAETTGDEWQDVADELAEENDYMESKGLNPTPNAPIPAVSAE